MTDCGHRQTFDDDSPRGEHYIDDRTTLAYVYCGTDLHATLHHEREARRYREQTGLVVSLTAAGECRIADDCPAETRGEQA